MNASEFDVDDVKQTTVVRRHREDKHPGALKNPLLVRRYDHRARGAWRRRRRDAKRNSLDTIGGAEGGDEVTLACDVVTPFPIPVVCDWEVVHADDVPSGKPQHRWFYQRVFAWFGV